MTRTKPLINYPAVKTHDNKIMYEVTRTRNIWNRTYTGNFVDYDHLVTDVLRRYICPKCDTVELLWDSQFDTDNSYYIVCDVCDLPLLSVESLG